MSEKKSFRERLLELGVPEEILNEYMDEELETMKKEMEGNGLEEDYVAKLFEYRDYIENFDKYKRKRVGITIAKPVYELLQYFLKDIETADGKPYPFSYFVEDMIVWLLNNPEFFLKFLDETYMDTEEEEEDEGSEEEES